MKYAHFIEMRVFCKEEDDEDQIIEKIKELFPFDYEQEKIEMKSKISYGFEDNKINVISIKVRKGRHTSKVLKNLVNKLNDEQRQLLIKQLDSRLDDKLHFYLRLAKNKLLNNEYWITDSGKCFHFKVAVAAYPHKRKVAKKIVKELLS